MEQAGLSVEPGGLAQLEPEYQLDLNANADADADGYDFPLDGAYDEPQQLLSVPVVDDVADSKPESEIGYDDENGQGDGDGADEQAHAEVADEVAESASKNADAEAEVEDEVEYYEDEIGYDEDDGVATDIGVDSEAAPPAEEDAVPSNMSSVGHREAPQLAEEIKSEVSAHETNSGSRQELDSEEHEEGLNLQDHLIDAEEHKSADPATDDELVVDGFDEINHEQYALDHDDELRPGPGDGEKALRELDDILADSVKKIPDIEVVYNESCYALFGTPDDDPESYFLSDIKVLDCPLSQFLSSLRSVIESELAPTDELLIRFDPLNLEFGERSNERFLSRSFREILDCHAALAAKDSSVSADVVIQLVVRRDSEEHFLELLADAELDDDRSQHSDHSEASEMHDEQLQASPRSDNQDESSEDRHSDEYPRNAEDRVDAEDTTAPPFNGHDEPEFEVVSDHGDVAGEQEDEFQLEASESQSQDNPRGEVHNQEDSVHESFETQSRFDDEHSEDAADGGQTWTEQLEGDETSALQHPEHPLETTDESQTAHHVGNDSGDTAGLNTAHGTAAPASGGYEQETTSNGKYPPPIFPAHHISLSHKRPISLPTPPDDEGEDLFIEDINAQGGDLVIEDIESWEIDYSDDEDEPSPSSTSASQCLTHKGRSPVSSPLRTEAGGAEPLAFGNDSPQHGNIYMSFSPSGDANIPVPEDDNLALALEEGTGLSATQEEDEYEEYTITYDAEENAGDEAEGISGVETIEKPQIDEDVSDLVSKNSQSGAHVAATAETASIQTSGTLEGDEIDYEDHNAANDSLTLEDDGAQQPLAASGVENNEIDWENDGDGYEQLPADADGGVDYEEQEAPLSPSRLAGKRSRTDEAESLADETGTLGSHPPKRLRMG